MRFYPFVFTSTDEGGIAAYYNYSADGERNFKFTSPRLNIQQNASLFNNPPLLFPTLYASSLVTLTKQGYTNVTEVESRASSLALPRCSNVTERTHYFEEGRRVCSKLGGGVAVQYIQYLLYGEPYDNQPPTGYRSVIRSPGRWVAFVGRGQSRGSSGASEGES